MDWVNIMIQVPADTGQQLLEHLEREHDFVEIDWCEKQRHQDYARVSYGPCEPLTSSGYTIPPFGKTS